MLPRSLTLLLSLAVFVPASVRAEPTASFARTRRGGATIAIGSIAAASLLATVLTGSLTLAEKSRYRSSCLERGCDDDIYRAGRSLAIATDVLIGITAATTVATIVLVATRPKEPRLSMSIEPRGLTLRGRF